MSANENQAHESFIKKTPRQLVVVVVLSFVVFIIVVVLLWQLASSGRIYDRDSPAMSAEAIAKRIGPVADVGVEVGGAGAASPAAAAGPATKAAALSVDGKKVYETTCVACHAAGVANAPKFGDKAAWAPHLTHGAEHLHENALKGIGAMPPKGGNLALSDAEVKAAVDYMVSAAK